MRDIKQIYVVFKTHFDIGFTGLAREIIERYGRKMLPDVIKTCEQTQALGADHAFVWTMAAWPLVQSLLPEHASPEDVERAEGLIRRGQLAWHTLPYTTHTEFCGLEEYIRGFRSSVDLSARYGPRVLSAKMTDVPGHTWILPTLLHKAGVRLLHLGCNPGCKPPDVPRLFFWEGPDGSRVLTFYNKGYYGSSLIPPEDWPFPVWLALMQTGDNHGPQGPQDIQLILDSVHERLPDTQVKMATMDDFYDALSQYPLDDVPVVRADLADTWIHGVGTYPAEVRKLRELRGLLTETEKALSLAGMLGVLGDGTARDLDASMARAFERTLLFGEHTWGLDVKSTLRRRYYDKREFLAHKGDQDVLRIEESWDEQRSRVTAAAREVGQALPVVMDALAAQVVQEGRRLVAFNGLGWSRGAWIDVSPLSLQSGESAVDAQTGRPLPTAWVDGKPMAYLDSLPALGYQTLTAGKAAPQAQGTVSCCAQKGIIENRWFKVRADAATGSVISMVEKASGKEWVDTSRGFGLGQYQYDVYGLDDVTEFIRAYAYRFSDWLINDLGRVEYPEVGHSTYLAKDFTIASRADGMGASLILTTRIGDGSTAEYGNATELETQITLYENQPFIDLAVRLKGKQETPYIEAGHIVMPFNLADHQVRINKVGSVLDPLTDIAPGANHGLYCCENWLDLSASDGGMAVMPMDMPLFSLGDQAIYQYHPEAAKKPPVVFFNLFNNSWGTNFPQWMGGDFTFRYRLMPHKGGWQQGQVPRMALESVTPVLTGYADGGKGELPLSQDLAELPDGVAVLALKRAYDGNGHVLRLRECNGQQASGDVKLSLPVTAKECNLLEDVAGATKDGTGQRAIQPFDIRSLRLVNPEK